MNNTFVVDINLGSLRTSKNFLKIINEKLYFPRYFGFNFNALDECMQDLSWLTEEKIIINFKNIKRLKEKNKSLYDEIYNCLCSYKEYWEENQLEKKVIINF